MGFKERAHTLIELELLRNPNLLEVLISCNLLMMDIPLVVRRDENELKFKGNEAVGTE